MMRAALGALLAGLLAACSVLQGPQAEDTATWLLEPASVPAAPLPRRDLTLAVSMPRARPGFQTPLMAYMQQPGRIEYFAKNRWADTPAGLIGPLLEQALERSGGFRAVIRTPGAAAADLRLDAELVRLQQDFGAGPSRVQLALRVQLVELATRRVLASAEFEETEAAPSDDPRGGVAAANRALGRMLARVTAFCSEAAASPRSR